MKKFFYIIIIFVFFLSACSAETYHDDYDYSICFIGDLRSGNEIYVKLLRVIRLYRPPPECIVVLGDIVSRPGHEIEWHIFRYDSKSILPHIKFYTIIGNHDVNDSASEKIYIKNVDLPGNELYYTFQVENTYIINLDSEMIDGKKQITGDQYIWLENQLINAQADTSVNNIFITIHRPLYPQGAHIGDNLINAAQLQTLFETFSKVKIVLSGHDHSYYDYTENNILYITTGGGGSPLDNIETGFFHFTKIGIYKETNTINIKVIGTNGEIIKDYNF